MFAPSPLFPIPRILIFVCLQNLATKVLQFFSTATPMRNFIVEFFFNLGITIPAADAGQKVKQTFSTHGFHFELFLFYNLLARTIATLVGTLKTPTMPRLILDELSLELSSTKTFCRTHLIIIAFSLAVISVFHRQWT